MNIGGRKELFRSLVGSHNYNLNTPESDRDYKIFVLPTFDDLYFNKQFSKSIVGDIEDFDIHDIREVSTKLWWKANVNFLEVLFSEDIKINNDIWVYTETKELIQAIFNMKDDIVKMNLPYLYDACVGMYYNKMKYLKKGTKNTKHLIETFGYDLKQALNGWRILDFLRRFANTNFNNFKKAIWYEIDDNKRDFLLNIKSGQYLLNEYEEIIKDTLNDIETYWKPIYKNQKSNEETKEILTNLVKQIIKINI